MILGRFANLKTQDLIAPFPAKPRDSARLMLLDRKTKRIKHTVFAELPKFLRSGDCLVLNRSKVEKLRFRARKESGGLCDILLVSPLNAERTLWKILGRKIKEGNRLTIDGGNQIVSLKKTGGSFVAEFSMPLTGKYIDAYGQMPLPNYIINARKKQIAGESTKMDESTYQTVYAKEPGSIAAPTAGFHFTRHLINNLKAKKIEILYITLHIGWGTFKPVRTSPDKHRMLPESFFISKETVDKINKAKREKRRIIAVGTSTMRTLETCSEDSGFIRAQSSETCIFIYPPYKFKVADAFITNFHLPFSAPLYMTAAFAGEDLLYMAYKKGVNMKYRFYSYGDGMLII